MPLFTLSCNGKDFRTCCPDIAESFIRHPESLGFPSHPLNTLDAVRRCERGSIARLLRQKAAEVQHGCREQEVGDVIPHLRLRIAASPFAAPESRE